MAIRRVKTPFWLVAIYFIVSLFIMQLFKAHEYPSLLGLALAIVIVLALSVLWSKYSLGKVKN
ncbi:hypothetical protein J3L16_03930 [Alteromonas sp. 5E99-2]|uniref:hypothetical protein n=1 Tax=Alteromonas sp. 5E99-2 TaxID=2817683 RepID=UPI001A9856F6|nr:hypothetical protein [Alteromonas sp. 5E99-2]MBO1254837.1 hypothetical protein [Alteromonas sp. 5E99-2]